MTATDRGSGVGGPGRQLSEQLLPLAGAELGLPGQQLLQLLLPHQQRLHVVVSVVLPPANKKIKLKPQKGFKGLFIYYEVENL